MCEPHEKKPEYSVKKLPVLSQDFVKTDKKKFLECISPKTQKNKFKPGKPKKVLNFTPQKVNKIVDYFENLQNQNLTSTLSARTILRLEGISQISDFTGREKAEQ